MVMFHLGCDDLRVQRAASLVDIPAVGTGMSDDNFATQIREELWSDRRRSSIRTVDDDTASVEREPRNSGEQKVNILSAVGLVDLRRDGLLRNRRQPGELVEYLFFNSEFHRVGQFVTIWTEQLDPVVLPGIVRGRNNDARRETVRMSEKADSSRRDNACALYRRSSADKARGESSGNPVAGLASVHAKQNAR